MSVLILIEENIDARSTYRAQAVDTAWKSGSRDEAKDVESHHLVYFDGSVTRLSMRLQRASLRYLIDDRRLGAKHWNL